MAEPQNQPKWKLEIDTILETCGQILDEKSTDDTKQPFTHGYNTEEKYPDLLVELPLDRENVRAIEAAGIIYRGTFIPLAHLIVKDNLASFSTLEPLVVIQLLLHIISEITDLTSEIARAENESDGGEEENHA